MSQSYKYCETCMTSLDQHESRACRRCKCKEERAKWLSQVGCLMDKFKMETTGSESIDSEVAKYRI